VSNGKRAKGSVRRYVLLSLGAIAAAAAFIANAKTIKDAWCDTVGFQCRFDVDSGPVYAESGGTTDNKSDVCKSHTALACVKPSRNGRRLVAGSERFDVSQRSEGVFIDGDPKSNDPIGTSNVGWFVPNGSKSEDKICATVYARTSACETKVFIGGTLRGREFVSFW
jgi:hypothetical protein